MIDYRRACEIVREEMHTDYLPNACIAAARVATLALRRLALHSEAMACELEAYSPRYVEMFAHFAALGRQPTAEEVFQWRDRGAWRVTLAFDDDDGVAVNNRTPTGYRGHVVVLAEGRTVLLDPTLAQVNRPEKGLVVPPPFVFPVEFETRELTAVAEGGSMLCYRFLPGRRDFTRAPDWRTPGSRAAIKERIVNRIVQRLQEEGMQPCR